MIWEDPAQYVCVRSWLYKKASWVHHGNKPVNNFPPWLLCQLLLPGSRFRSYPDFSQRWAVNGMCMPSKLLLIMVFITAVESKLEEGLGFRFSNPSKGLLTSPRLYHLNLHQRMPPNRVKLYYPSSSCSLVKLTYWNRQYFRWQLVAAFISQHRQHKLFLPTNFNSRC